MGEEVVLFYELFLGLYLKYLLNGLVLYGGIL